MMSGKTLATPSHNLLSWGSTPSQSLSSRGLCECCTLVCLIVPETVDSEEKEIGSLEAGKLADIVAVDEDPLKNIKTMLKVTFVMKDGVVYKNE